uniref:IF rod domain-containing protein n=1 Tax=Calidris pygmaea TaxID=425635 RepID=A0A8C3K087_9CHAR
MESFAGARALGEESLQMWDLNKRLEAYLARVKFLEEENEVLRAEIQSAKGSPAGESWRAKYEEELRALRDALDHAFREKCTAELARDNLYEEVQQVKSRCQKEQAAREEAKKQLSLSRKELEEERRAQIWLKERAVQLEKEVEALLEVHEEEKAGLDQEIASFSQSLESFRCAPVAFQPVEVEDYSKRLSEIWKGAVETYKTEVSQLEGSLCQAKENLWKAVEDNQQSQLQLQHLEKDLAGLKARKEMLEESLARQWQEQRGDAEKFQLAMEALEQEKQTLRVQIAQVLEDRQQLMHLKMSLSLEVATYSPIPPIEARRGAEEGQDPSKDGEAPKEEERAVETVFQGLGAGPHPGSTGASLSREETGPWEEEVPTVPTPREPEGVAQEEDTSGPGQTGTGLEEPERGEDEEEETPRMEVSHPSEYEEERGPRSPYEDDDDFQGEGMDEQEESPQREIEAAIAVPMESQPVLPVESHLEEDLVDGEQEKFEHREMPVCEMDLAAEEESGQETWPGQEICLEQEPSSIHEAISAEEVSSGAEEDAVGGEDTGRAEDGEGEKGEASREALGGEDPQAGEAEGPEALGQESGAQEEPEDLQENGFVEEVQEQEELEPELGEEPWAGRDDGSSQKPPPEDWEVTAEDTEGALGAEEPAWADDTPTSAGGVENEERDASVSPAELEENQEDDEEEDAESQGTSQQQPPPEAELAPGLARDEQEATEGQPDQAPDDATGQVDSQEPTEALEEPWEVQDEDADDEVDLDPGQLESDSAVPTALQQAPGDGMESGELEEEEEDGDEGRRGELEEAPGMGRKVELEDTLPDSTPLHLYQGEMLEETTEAAPASQTAPEDEGWDKPPTPTVPESCEEEARMEVAPTAEGTEEEEGYFMVSAPSQEVSSSEEAEITEDFEEIKVEATEASKDDLEAAREASPVAEDEGHFEAFVGEADEDVKMPTEEPEVPKDEDEDFTAEREEGSAVPEVDPSFPGAAGSLAGGTDEPAQGATGSDVQEGAGSSEGLAPESDEELDGAIELETDAGRAETLPGLVGQEEKEEEEEEDDNEDPCTAHHDVAEPIPPAELQAQVMPASPPPDHAEQTSDEQPPEEEEAPAGDRVPSARDEEPPEADPPQPGSAPEQGDFPELIKESPEGDDPAAKAPADVMKDSDILEIVEQALEFNQELVRGVRAAEGGKQDPGETEQLPRDAGEDSSPASSSEEEPTVQEAPAEVAPGTEGPVRAENGLHREASLEDLAEFTEEVPNGIAGLSPAPEFPAETPDPTGGMPPQPPAPGDATAAKLADATPRGKHGGADTVPVTSSLGDDGLCLVPDQPPACRLRAEQEPWSSGDE